MNTSTPKSLTARFRAFFTSRLSARWFAHLALVEVLIFSLVVLPSTTARSAFNNSAGDYDIWTEAGRAGHWFAIQEGSDPNSPVHFNSGSLWIPGTGGGNRVHGNYNGGAAPNGMIIRDLTTNEFAPLPDDGGGVSQIAPGSWSPADGGETKRVYFTIGWDRGEHTLQLIQSNGATHPVTIDTNNLVSGGMYGDMNTPWPTVWSWETHWEALTYTGSAVFDPALPFRIVDLSTNEQSPENVTNIANWEPLPGPLPVQEVRVVLPSFAGNQTFTVHSQVPWGPVMHQSVVGVPQGYFSSWAINYGSYFWAESSALVTFSAPEGASFWITNDSGGRWPGGEGTHTVPDSSLSMYHFDGLDFPQPPPPPSVAVTLRINAESFYNPATIAPENLATHHWQLWTNAGMIAESNPSYGINTFAIGNETITTEQGQQIDNPISIITLTAQVPEGVDWWVIDGTTGQTMPIGQSDFFNGWMPHIPLPVAASSLDIHSERLSPQGFYAGYISIGIAPTSFQSTHDTSSIRWISGLMLNGATPAGSTVQYDREFWNEQTHEYYTLPYTHLEYDVPGEWGASYLLVIQNDIYSMYYQNYFGEEIALNTGPTDDTTWLPAPQPVYLNISESRWGHDLVLRHVDGREYPIYPGQTQGDTSWNPGSANHAWVNSYYYFNANTQATPGMAWYIVDKTVGDSAGYGQTNLVDWIVLTAPEISSFGDNGFGSINVAVTAQANQTAAIELERSIDGGPWHNIFGTEIETQYPGTTWWTQYEAPYWTSTHRFRARTTFGGRYSQYSAIAQGTFTDADSDGDGMSDRWEISVGLNPSFAGDATSDGDGDSLSNLAEYQNRTNPNSNDTDADGMPDGWEVAHSLNPLDDDAHQDLDFDTRHNFTEYLYGTNPSDHYNGARPNIAPPQPTSASATVSNGELRVEWDDKSSSETAFAIYKRTIDASGNAIFQLLGRETPAATLFEKTIAPDEVLEGDHIVVIAEPSSTPPPNYVAAVVNQPFLVRFDQVTEAPIITYIPESNTILGRTAAQPVVNPPAPKMSVDRTPKKANMEEVKVKITSTMYRNYVVSRGWGLSHSEEERTEQVYSTVALKRIEGEDWVQFAAPSVEDFEETRSVGIGKVNTFAVYTGRNIHSSGGLSTFLDEEYAGVSGSVSAYFDTYPYDPSPNIPSLSSPDFWAAHAGPWFHRPFEITQTALPNHSAWPVSLGSWSAQERDNERDASFVQPGIHDLSAYWQFAGGLPEGVYLDEQVNISVGDSFSYPLPGNINERRFIVPRAWGTVTGEAAKRFDPLADSYPTYFAIPAPGEAHSFSINLHANVPNATEHGAKWTVNASGGVTFSDGLASKEFDSLDGSGVAFKATTHGEIEFRFGDVFAGKIIVKAYQRLTLRVLHVGITHVDPMTNKPSNYSRYGAKLPVANEPRIPDPTGTDEVWIDGGPNIKIEHIIHHVNVNVLYKTKSNTTYEPDYTGTSAVELTDDLKTGTASVRQAYVHDIVCYWLYNPRGNAEPGIGQPDSRALILFYNAGDGTGGYAFSHELGHTLGLEHPFAWIDNQKKPADPGMMIMGYYTGTGFPGSQIDAVRKYVQDKALGNP